MNSHPSPASAAVLRIPSIALIALCLAGCGGSDAIAPTGPSHTKEPPAIQPIGVTPRAAGREGAAISAQGTVATISVRSGEPLVAPRSEAHGSEPDDSTEDSPRDTRDTARDDDPSDDGSEVTPIAVDEFGAPQPEPAAARR